MEAVVPKVTEEINLHMNTPISEEEVYKALQQMNIDKSPGPDKLNAGFYKHNRQYIGKGVVNYVMHFFNTGYLNP